MYSGNDCNICLKGDLFLGDVNGDWDCLSESLKFRRMFVVPAGVIVFFKSVSHQPYKTADLHLQIRMAGMSTEHYVQSMVHDTGQNYTQQMSKPGTWCDNIIILAVSNAFNCIDSNALC